MAPLGGATEPDLSVVVRGETTADVSFTGTYAGDEHGGKKHADDLPSGYVLAGQYEIISLLGRGGMSAVYKAKNRVTNRLVAVKCLHAHLLADNNAILRFQKEAKAAGNLNHPHIVRIHQYGLDKDERPFLVMDYLDGQSLQDLLNTGTPIPLDDALRLLLEAADGLNEAHSQGLVHRDFKPSNIMLVTAPNGKKTVKIVDFGIAKVVAAEGDVHRLTRPDELLGSPKYMSPEQCMLHELDNRSDIYSFGCAMFAMFAGYAPFRSRNLVEVYYKHMTDLPESISVSRPDIKEAAQLDAIILKCMAKEPPDRYQSMVELGAAIQTVVVGGKQNPVDCLKDQMELKKLKGKAERATEPRQVKKTKRVPAVAALSVVALVVIVPLGMSIFGQAGKPIQKVPAVQPVPASEEWTLLTPIAPSREAKLKALDDSIPTKLLFVNLTGKAVKVYGLDSLGRRKSYGQIAAHAKSIQKTFATHPFILTDKNNMGLAIFVAVPEPAIATLERK